MNININRHVQTFKYDKMVSIGRNDDILVKIDFIKWQLCERREIFCQ